MKKLHASNHKFYEQDYVDQAKQKGGIYQHFTELDFSDVMASVRYLKVWAAR